MTPITVEIDGSSRRNPGPAGLGIRILDREGEVLKEISRAVGVMTNNQAEYRALILALQEVKAYLPADVVIRTDSELLYRQMHGQYRVKHPGLRPLHDHAHRLMAQIGTARLIHVPRELNRAADRLARQASRTDEASRGVDQT